MKGPFERLKYDLRRVWECPECHHKERADGTVTTVICRCQAKNDLLDRKVMKLVEDRIQRRVPIFVPPTDNGDSTPVGDTPEQADAVSTGTSTGTSTDTSTGE